MAGWAWPCPYYGSEFAVSMALDLPDVRRPLATSWSAVLRQHALPLSLATSAFFGIGAYTSALWLETCRLAVVAPSAPRPSPAGVAVVMGAAVLHLRGTYFAVLTFGMTELIRHAVTYWEKQVTGTVGRVLTVVPERDTIYLTVLGLAVLAILTSIVVRAAASAWRWPASAPTSSARRRLGVNTRLVKIAGFALTPPLPARWARR